MLEVGEVPRFVKQIKLRGFCAAFGGEFGHREAATVDREAVAHLEPATGFAELQREPNRFVTRVDGFHRAGFFDNARKHRAALNRPPLAPSTTNPARAAAIVLFQV